MTAIALPFCPHTTLSYLFEKKLVAPQATQNILLAKIGVGTAENRPRADV